MDTAKVYRIFALVLGIAFLLSDNRIDNGLSVHALHKGAGRPLRSPCLLRTMQKSDAHPVVHD